jgi:hypothetical protein
MFYPHDKNDIKAFTPEALRDLPNPPVFHLRAGTVRDKNQFTRLIIEEGAQKYDLEDMRAEIIAGLKELGGEEAFGEWEPRIKGFWDALDSHEKEVEAIVAATKADHTPELPPFTYEDEGVVSAILQSIEDKWRPLRKMKADNVLANRMQPIIMAQIIITKVDNLEVDLERDGKYLTFECAGEVRDELQELARSNNLDANEVIAQLNREILQRLFVPKSAEKNSVSPSPSSSDQNSSETGTAAELGTSTASESSTPTPDAS